MGQPMAVDVRDPITEPLVADAPRGLTWGRAALGILIAVAIVSGLSALVGWRAARADAHGFDWELAAIVGTALGTTLLAGVTGALAATTARDVQATQQLARQGQRREELEQRPMVMLFSFTYHALDLEEQRSFIQGIGGDPNIPLMLGWNDELRVVLFNFGLGPAVDVRVRATYNDADHQPVIPEVVRPAIRPGGTDEFTFRVNFVTDLPERIREDSFAIEGSYADRTGDRRYRVITEWAERTVLP